MASLQTFEITIFKETQGEFGWAGGGVCSGAVGEPLMLIVACLSLFVCNNLEQRAGDEDSSLGPSLNLQKNTHHTRPPSPTKDSRDPDPLSGLLRAVMTSPIGHFSPELPSHQRRVQKPLCLRPGWPLLAWAPNSGFAGGPSTGFSSSVLSFVSRTLFPPEHCPSNLVLRSPLNWGAPHPSLLVLTPL